MIEKAPTLGSVETSDSQKQRFAKMSLDYNVRDPAFCKLFPEYVQLHKEKLHERKSDESTSAATSISSDAGARVRMNDPMEMHGVVAAAAGIVAVVSIFFAMRLYFV
jgi:ubiquitin-conjugating enzyme E2 J2